MSTCVVRRLCLAVILLAAGSPAVAQSVRYGEPWRPGYHFSPEVHWMNEPTGLIYIAGVNDAPVPLNDTGTTDQNSSLAMTPLTNDSDVDGPSLSITEINGVALVGGMCSVRYGV